MRLAQLKDYLAYIVIRVCICVVQAMPLKAAHRVAKLLASLANDILKIRRNVVHSNLEIAFPEYSEEQRDEVSRKMWEHLFLMIAEIAHTPRKLHATNWRKHIRFRDMQQATWLLLQRRPMVIVSGHYGNFELSGYVLGMLGFATFTVARTLDNIYIDRFLNRFRGATGQYMLPKEGSSEIAGRMLENCGKLAILGDQHAGPKGYWIEFFGKLTSTHKAISIFALSNDARLALGFARRLEEPLIYELGFQGVADPQSSEVAIAGGRSLTTWHCAQLEEVIREEPTQYWWVHRRWRGDIPAAHLKRHLKRKMREAA